MASSTTGIVDYRAQVFVARFQHDASAVAEIKTLQRRHWEDDSQEWIIEAHRPSVSALLRIARDHSWQVTDQARHAIQQLQQEADPDEYSVDVVQGSGGEPWFFCKLGDDDALRERVKAIPASFMDDADDSWWVPAYQADSCQPLLEIVQSDDRLVVSDAAYRLLEEPGEL